MLIYQAFDWQIPSFAHVSLILAPDKSKLSKRHGATSVGEFREQGCLAPAMVNFLSLLGWNDGSEQEIFSTHELQEKFSLDRVTKSAAVFDKTKLVRRLPPSPAPLDLARQRPGRSNRKSIEDLHLVRAQQVGALPGVSSVPHVQNWMNGQYIKALPEEEAVRLLSEQWNSSQLLTKYGRPAWFQAASHVGGELKPLELHVAGRTHPL